MTKDKELEIEAALELLDLLAEYAVNNCHNNKMRVKESLDKLNGLRANINEKESI